VVPERKAFVLRINKDLWDELQRMAAQELRSVNAQIEYLLREAVAKRGRRLRAPNSDDARGKEGS
jgi:hypothetical protein